MFLRKIAASFFLVVFMAMVSAPSIISTLDSTIDISLFYNINEEEEKQVLKLFFERVNGNIQINSFALDFSSSLEYRLGSYANPFLSEFSPPPELHLI
ncbi:hypothetical protein [Aegicerativicinus sediminis]|uniref:hypothetical protein n=1 Tax=Aegicerativicinus sediminis TaxID=2893202 RepID=UPI001E369117|nr:hypothetical protein [Aegicerativicinus sediminis]